MNNTINEVKNALEGINSRITEVEEEIGSLPEKEFRIMVVKMIQNLRNRMEAQIEKIQEMFNKDLEELKEQTNRDEQHNN